MKWHDDFKNFQKLSKIDIHFVKSKMNVKLNLKEIINFLDKLDIKYEDWKNNNIDYYIKIKENNFFIGVNNDKIIQLLIWN